MTKLQLVVGGIGLYLLVGYVVERFGILWLPVAIVAVACLLG